MWKNNVGVQMSRQLFNLNCIFNLKVLPVLIHNLTCSHSYINAHLLLLFIYQLTIYMLIAF